MSDSGTYKPTEHDGLKQDGTPDQRVGTGEFAQGKVDPHEAGKQGGQTSSGNSGGENYKPTEHGGKKADGTEDGRVGTGEFAHGKVDPHEAGKKGGQTS